MPTLTNPDSVVTEERLAQFYQQILPYLGGMPDILANKFSKADLYSTDEKMIGRWIDGKPIYQKTVSGTNGAVNTDANIADIADVDTVVSLDGICTNYAGTGITMGIPSDTLFVKYQNGKVMTYTSNSSYANKPCIITIKYTKTTDSAVDIGSDTDYSTTEKIVGTWIDGKPIWQKTVDCGALPNNTTKSIAHGISNLDYVIDCRGYSLNPTSNARLPIPYVSTSSSSKGISIALTDTEIQIGTDYNRSAYTSTYVTLQYTKQSS